MGRKIILILSLLLILTACMKGTMMPHGPMMDSTQEQEGKKLVENNRQDYSNMPMGHGPRMRQARFDSSTGENELKIPDLLEPDQETKDAVYYTIEAMQGETEFFEGQKTKTLGYNGNLLGPIIKLKAGQDAHFTLKNSLREETTFHWHGLIVDGLADGGPHDPIYPGEEREISFPVQQEAATLWFHPHPLGKTARQVYEGLAGLLYIEDGLEDFFSHGMNDFPLILQDRAFTEDYQIDYETAYHPDGVIGNKLLVNGTLDPRLTVPKGKVRLRLLNGSNKINYSFQLSDGSSFHQIGTDGGLLGETIELTRLSLSPAERAEIVIDFSAYSPGQDLSLVTEEGTVILPFMIDENMPIKDFELTDLNRYQTDKSTLSSTHVDKKLVLSGHGHHVSINGKKFNEDRIDFTQKLKETEIWEVYNQPDRMGGSDHPFHIHGTQFEILSLNGEDPPKSLQGLKDTVPLAPGDRALLAVSFDEPGVFMFHCHILEHEDLGMMGQVLVE